MNVPILAPLKGLSSIFLCHSRLVLTEPELHNDIPKSSNSEPNKHLPPPNFPRQLLAPFHQLITVILLIGGHKVTAIQELLSERIAFLTGIHILTALAFCSIHSLPPSRQIRAMTSPPAMNEAPFLPYCFQRETP